MVRFTVAVELGHHPFGEIDVHAPDARGRGGRQRARIHAAARRQVEHRKDRAPGIVEPVEGGGAALARTRRVLA